MNECRPKVFCVLSLIAGLALSISHSQAASLLEDGFATGAGDYTAGPLVGQTGTPEVGSYPGAWGGSGTGANFGEAQVIASGLSYSDTAGNMLNVSGGAVRMARTATGGPFQKDASVDPAGTLPGTSGDSVYFSGILDPGGAGNAWFGIRTGPSSSKDTIGIGVNSSGNAEIRQDGTVSATSIATFDIDDPLFLVGRIEADGAGGSNDLVSLYVNPSLTAEPGAADLTFNVGTAGWFPGQDLEVLQLSALMATDAEATLFDEFRIGSSWADVTPFTAAPVPEPASIAIWSLIGMGLVGFGYHRVRRKT